MREDLGNYNYESKDIPINVFESIQIDFKPEKPKKRRKADDYDYNDPFLESFEGEFDAVELECKLENFFVHKGTMEDDPRKISRKYNNNLKKTKLCDVIAGVDQRVEASAPAVLFEFERMLASVLNPGSKYKKESKLENSLMCVIFMESPKNDVEHHLKYKILSLYNDKKYGSGLNYVDPVELEEGLEILRSEVENMFKAFLVAANDDGNFSRDKKSFNKFKEGEFTGLMVDFCVKYMKYYAATTNESLQYIKNRALEHLNAMLPDQCTNKIRLKHYLLKCIHSRIESGGYSLKDAVEGEFINLDDTQHPACRETDISPRSVISDDIQFGSSFSRSFSYPLEDNKRSDFARAPFPISYPHAVRSVFSSGFISSYDNTRSRGDQAVTGDASRDLLASSDALLSSVGSRSQINVQEFTQSTEHGKDKRNAASTDFLLSPGDSIPGFQNKSSDGSIPEASTSGPSQSVGARPALKNSSLETEEYSERS